MNAAVFCSRQNGQEEKHGTKPLLEMLACFDLCFLNWRKHERVIRSKKKCQRK